MAGGTSRAFERARPVLEAMGRTVAHLRPDRQRPGRQGDQPDHVRRHHRGGLRGDGVRARPGAAAEQLIDTLGKGAGSCWYFVHRAPNMARGSYPAGFRVRLHAKDLAICHDMAARFGVALPVVERMLAEYAELVARGYGDEDISATFRLKEELFERTNISVPRRAGRAMNADRARERALYLPNFCTSRATLAIVLIVELTAFVLTLARQGALVDFWTDLVRTSLFLLWMGLTAAALLCLPRHVLARLTVAAGSAAVMALIAGLVATISMCAYLIGRTHLVVDTGGASSSRSIRGASLCQRVSDSWCADSRCATSTYRTSGGATSTRAAARVTRAGAHPPALPLQQHEHDRRADPRHRRSRNTPSRTSRTCSARP